MPPENLPLAFLTTWKVRASTLLAVVVAVVFAAAAMALTFMAVAVVLVALLR